MTEELDHRLRAALGAAADAVASGPHTAEALVSRQRHRRRAVTCAAAAAAALSVGGVALGAPALRHSSTAASDPGSLVTLPTQATATPAAGFRLANPALLDRMPTATPAFTPVDAATARTALEPCIVRERSIQTVSDNWQIETAVKLPPTTATVYKLDSDNNVVGSTVGPAPESVFISAKEVGTPNAFWCISSTETAGEWTAGAGGMQPIWLSDGSLPAPVTPVGVGTPDFDQVLSVGYVAKGVKDVSVSLHGVKYPTVVRDGFYYAVTPLQRGTTMKADENWRQEDEVLTANDNGKPFTAPPPHLTLAGSSCWISPSGQQVKPPTGRSAGKSTVCAKAYAWARTGN